MPAGNTGGANVGALRSMAVTAELAELLEGNPEEKRRTSLDGFAAMDAVQTSGPEDQLE